MKLLSDLQHEHVLIERVVSSLFAFACACEEGKVAPMEGAGYLRFFRDFAGTYHHAREEEVLFPALVRETEAPADRGPLRVLLQDHREMSAMLDAMEPLFDKPASPEDGRKLKELATRYATALLHHIDAENTVLFPESEIRFRRTSTLELDSREPDERESAARIGGEALAERFAPRVVPGVDRGEGCVACPVYGTSCDGIEREWWNELEWEDALARMGSD